MFKVLVDAIFNLFAFAVSKFPVGNGDVAAFIQFGLYDAKSFLAPYNWIFPVDTLFFCFNLFVGCLAGMIVFVTVRWILSILTLNIIH